MEEFVVGGVGIYESIVESYSCVEDGVMIF